MQRENTRRTPWWWRWRWMLERERVIEKKEEGANKYLERIRGNTTSVACGSLEAWRYQQYVLAAKEGTVQM
jgi:hypothetical protein